MKMGKDRGKNEQRQCSLNIVIYVIYLAPNVFPKQILPSHDKN